MMWEGSASLGVQSLQTVGNTAHAGTQAQGNGGRQPRDSAPNAFFPIHEGETLSLAN